VIGVFGGSFDPVHYGHLRPVQETAAALALKPVLYIPSGRPPHRPPPRASAEDRVAMLRLALGDDPGFRVDSREIERFGPSYTVETLESLRETYRDATFCLLVGMDAFLGLPQWHRWEELFELAHVAVMQRPGIPEPVTLPDWARERLCDSPRALARAPAGRCYIQPVTPLDISSTRVRERLARGLDVSQWLPPSVLEYIREHRLYRGAR